MSVFDTMYHAEGDGINERAPNYLDGEGGFYLVRCYVCDPEFGRENYAPSIALGLCAWCGAGEYGAPAKESQTRKGKP